MPPTRAEKRSLLTFYNALPENCLAKPRIFEAALALMVTFELKPGREDRALAELESYQGGKLTMGTFPAALAMATKMYRDNPDTFVEVFGTEAEFRARNRDYFSQGEDATGLKGCVRECHALWGESFGH